MTVVQNPYITKRKVITNTNSIGIGSNNYNTLIPTASTTTKTTTTTTTSSSSSSLASSLLDVPRHDILPSVQEHGKRNDTAINSDTDSNTDINCNNVDANDLNADNTTTTDQQQQPQQHQQEGQELQVQRDETNPLHENQNIGLPLPASTTTTNTTTTSTSTTNEMISSSSSSFAISSLLSSSSSSSVTNRTSSTDIHYGQRLPSQTIPLVSAEIVTIPEIYTSIIPKLQQQQQQNTNPSLEYQRPKSIRITGIILHYHHHTSTNNNSSNNNNYDNIISLIVGNPLVVGLRLPPTPITIDNYKTIYSTNTTGGHIDSVTSNTITKNCTNTKKPILSSINRLKTPLMSTMKRPYPSSSYTNTTTTITTTTTVSKKPSSSQRVSFAPVLTSNTATSSTTTPRTESISPNTSTNTMMKTTTVKKKPILVYQKKVSTNKLLLSSSTKSVMDGSSGRRLSFAPNTSTTSSLPFQSRNTNDDTDVVKNDNNRTEVVHQQLLSYKRLVYMINESSLNKSWIWIQINPSCTNIIGTIHTNDLITVFGELILPISKENTNHNDDDDDVALQQQSIETNGNEIEQTNSIVHTDMVDENGSNAETPSTMSENNDLVNGAFHETRSNNVLVDTNITNRDHNLPTIERKNCTTTSEDEIDNDHTMQQTIKSCCCYIKARIVRNANGTNMKHYTEALYKRRQCLPSIQSSTSL